jgi:hypothetical protein
MSKIKAKLLILVSAVMTAVTVLAPFQARAAEVSSVVTLGDWTVATVAKGGADWRIEAYKVDKGLVAWTELNSAGTLRKLYAYDGVNLRALATIAKGDWNENDAAFVEPVKGDFDVADGLVVWTQFDGNDREIYAFDGADVKKVSDNSYDDRHPVTGGGRVAWTSSPTLSSYNLMVKENGSIRKLAQYHVINYAFSGKNLFWINKLPNETWFRVFRDSGTAPVAIGEGDDRALRQYFFVDNKGTAGWEYSTKRWDYDKRVVYVSVNGNQAYRVLQRDVPPNITRIEDVDGSRGTAIVNVHDLLFTKINENIALTESDANGTGTIYRKGAMTKVRFMDGGFVLHREPDSNIGLDFRGKDRTDFITLDAIIHDRFDADGPAAAGAKVGGGVVLYADGKTVVSTSTVETSDITVKNGDVAWIEGTGDAKTLKFASRTILVKTTAGAKRVSGWLAKAPGNPAVYLVANDGKRYVFPGQGQYFGWYADFASVRTISQGALAGYGLGGNVLYRPGSRLLKTAYSPRVYAVGSDAALHWIASEDVIVSVYGSAWKGRLDTIDESLLGDYGTGSNITTDIGYYAALTSK